MRKENIISTNKKIISVYFTSYIQILKDYNYFHTRHSKNN